MRKILLDKAMERKKEIGEEQVWAALPYLDQHKTTERFSTNDFASFFRLQRKSTGVFEACVSMEEVKIEPCCRNIINNNSFAFSSSNTWLTLYQT